MVGVGNTVKSLYMKMVAVMMKVTGEKTKLIGSLTRFGQLLLRITSCYYGELIWWITPLEYRNLLQMKSLVRDGLRR